MAAYVIRFTPAAERQVAALPQPRRVAVFDAVERQLQHQPDVETRNRKPMPPDRPGYLAPWELRVGDLRMNHDVEVGTQPTVVVVAVGIKTRNRVRVGDQEYET